MKTTNNACDIQKTHVAAFQAGKLFYTWVYEENEDEVFTKWLEEIENSTEEYTKEGYIGVQYNTCKTAEGGIGSVLKGYRDVATESFPTADVPNLSAKLKTLCDRCGDKLGFFLSERGVGIDKSSNLILFRYNNSGRKNAVAMKDYSEKMPNTKKEEISQLESLGYFEEHDIYKYCSYRYVLRTCEEYGRLYRYPPKEVEAFYNKLSTTYEEFAQEKYMPYVSDKELITDANVKSLFITNGNYYPNRFFKQVAKSFPGNSPSIRNAENNHHELRHPCSLI